jgi:hypothetical protein
VLSSLLLSLHAAAMRVEEEDSSVQWPGSSVCHSSAPARRQTREVKGREREEDEEEDDGGMDSTMLSEAEDEEKEGHNDE